MKHDLDSRLVAEVFLDHRSIEPGSPWPERLRSTVAAADVVLVLVGKEWLRLQNEYGIRRLDEPDDWVRQEIETALEAGRLVLPVLVDGARQLQAAAFSTPQTSRIAKLAELQSLPLATKDWSHHLDALVARLVAEGIAPRPLAPDTPAVVPPVPDSSVVPAYCRAVESQHATSHFAGFKTRLRVPIDLEELHVPLTAVMDLRGGGDAGFGDAKHAHTVLDEAGSGREIALVSAFREAKQPKRRGIVVLGDPGSGKTTHLKRMLLWCLRRRPADLGLPDGPRISRGARLLE